MQTVNEWNNKVLDANVTFEGGTFSAGTDVADYVMNIGTLALLGRTINIGNLLGTSAVNVNTGSGGYNVATGVGPINIGTDAAVKTTTIGNIVGATATNLNAGTGGIALASLNGIISIVSGIGNILIGTDANAKNINIGNTVGASFLYLATGTSGLQVANITGDIIRSSSLGEVRLPQQPAFLAYVNNQINNVTGDGTEYTIIYDTESYDVGSNFNLGTSTFTAPVTGKYFFTFAISVLCVTANITSALFSIITSARTYGRAFAVGSGSSLAGEISILADMSVGQTAVFTVMTTDTGGKVDSIQGVSGGRLRNYVSGYLAC